MLCFSASFLLPGILDEPDAAAFLRERPRIPLLRLLEPVHPPRLVHHAQFVLAVPARRRREDERRVVVREVHDEGGERAEEGAGQDVGRVVAVVFEAGDGDPGCEEERREDEQEAEEARLERAGARERRRKGKCA